MTCVQASWLRGWARAQARVLERVLRGLARLLHDGGSPVYRRVYNAQQALRSLCDARDNAGIWTAGPWHGAPPELTDEQRDHLGGIANEVARELRTVAEYFDRAGCPSKPLGRAVRSAVNELGAIRVHLHYMTAAGAAGEPEPDPPHDPLIDCGSGI
jgi:hypothetical protein